MPTDSGRFSGMLTDVVEIFETSPHSVGEGGRFIHQHSLLDPIPPLN